MFLARMEKTIPWGTIPWDEEAEYLDSLCEKTWQELWGEKEQATPSDPTNTVKKENTPTDETPVFEEKKLSHDRKRKSSVLSPEPISSMKKSKKEKYKKNKKEKEKAKYKKEETKIEKISCSASKMLAVVESLVSSRKLLSFEMQMRNMERLLNQHMNKDNKVVPVNIYADSDSKSRL